MGALCLNLYVNRRIGRCSLLCSFSLVIFEAICYQIDFNNGESDKMKLLIKTGEIFL